jgi:hypothetical protein
MKHPFLTNNEPQGGSNVKKVFTARMFFGLDGEEAISTAEDFLMHGEGLTPKEALDLGKAIHCMSQGMRMNGNPYSGVDPLGKSYTWHEFKKAKADCGFKIINGGGIPALIDRYQDGLITINFTLDELIKVAREV